MFLILHNIRSVHNVGSIFRTADAAGVEKIYLAGVTPTPLDRFGRKRKDLAKVALGAEEFLSWEYKKSLSALISALKKDGYEIVALEQSTRAIDYRKFKIKNSAKNKIALILGEETKGVPKNILDKCDTIIEIPMRGRKESLNVSVATGIALFRIIR